VAHDAARDALLARAHGVRVLRIAAWLVERDIDSALALIRRALT
jgi:very-short-patch-repair endonuclease